MSSDDWFERAFNDRDGDEDDTREDESSAPERESSELEDESSEPETDVGPDVGPNGTREDVETPAADSPFDEDFSEAFNNAPDPELDTDGSAQTNTARNGDAGPDDPLGGEDNDMFDDFDSLGFGESELDEEDFDSNLDRIEIGIQGLDEMILGGIPAQSLITAIGGAGTGKTTIGLQFLNTALRNGERAVYITLEESRDRVLDTAEEKGWDFRQYEDDEMLVILDLNPIEMANSLSSIRNDLTRLISDFDAKRLVLDSVSLLELMYDHPARRRSEVFQFTRTLKRVGVTTFVTSEASDSDPFASRHGIIEYLADAVLVLRYVRSSSFQETRLAVEIQKIRDANHSRQPKPYEITADGISVHQQANLF